MPLFEQFLLSVFPGVTNDVHSYLTRRVDCHWMTETHSTFCFSSSFFQSYSQVSLTQVRPVPKSKLLGIVVVYQSDARKHCQSTEWLIIITRRLSWVCISAQSEFLQTSLFKNFLRVRVRTVPGNVPVRFEVRSFNCFKLVWLTGPLHTDNHTDRHTSNENSVSAIHLPDIIVMMMTMCT